MTVIDSARTRFLWGFLLLALSSGCSPGDKATEPTEGSAAPAAESSQEFAVAPQPARKTTQNAVWEQSSATAASSKRPAEDDSATGRSLVPTHRQAAIIRVNGDEATSTTLHTFCLDAAGNLLAGVTTDVGQIRKLDPEGNLLETWPLEVTPEAIAVGPDGVLYVAGSGKLLKLDAQGAVLLEADAPHAGEARANKEKIREQMREQLEQNRQSMAEILTRYQQQIDQLTAKAEEDRTEAEQQRLRSLQSVVERIQPARDEQAENETLDRMIQSKLAASSISVTSSDVFVATRALEGYGFDVWRVDDQFENGKKIVTGLRGCCGQMDVQANDAGVYVAENARHRVCHYDRDGQLVTQWGSRTRTGVEGFGSCCNPMNLAFNSDQDVYTAESTTGRIKRYSANGDLLGLVGQVEIVPGCKKVSIAVSPDSSRIYMLDITRTHIVMMQSIADDLQMAAVDPLR